VFNKPILKTSFFLLKYIYTFYIIDFLPIYFEVCFTVERYFLSKPLFYLKNEKGFTSKEIVRYISANHKTNIKTVRCIKTALLFYFSSWWSSGCDVFEILVCNS